MWMIPLPWNILLHVSLIIPGDMSVMVFIFSFIIDKYHEVCRHMYAQQRLFMLMKTEAYWNLF